MLKKRVNMKWSDAVQFICAVIVLCIVFIIATLLGEAHVNLSTIFEAIFHYNPKIQAHNVISEVRIP
ncbi:iron ABC transporter, partial [Staphylococcus pseudintermedius]